MEVCTIIAKNYVAHARVLARSLAEHNPQSRLWTLIIDDFAGYIDPAEEPFEILTPADVGCEPFTYMALRYSVVELSTAVKPWLLRHLMGETGGPVTYLDPDIEVHGSLARLDELAALHGVVLTPHNSTPIPPDGRKPSQIDIMIAGVYNLGYVSLAPRPEVERVLDWWSDRLRRDCRIDPMWGYFVDQRWFDLVPGFLTDFAILRDPEYNVAYWNLHTRSLEHDGDGYKVDGRPLAFFHFSGFDAEHPLALSRHQNRVDVASHPVLERLLSEYAERVMHEGHAVSRKWPYSYLALGDGTRIDDFVRTFCEEYGDEQELSGQAAPSPFTGVGAQRFEDWLREEATDALPGVNRVLARVYEERGDLQTAFPDPTGPDRDRLLSWAENLGSKEVPLLAKVGGAVNGAGHPAPGTDGKPSRSAARRPLVALGDGPWGVNVVGHFGARGELGEVARQIVSTFDASGTPSAPINDSTAPFTDESEPYATLPPGHAPFLVNLVCTSPDALPEFARHSGEQFFGGRYSIGLWFCDLKPPPRALDDAFRHLQEVWAPSAYGARLLDGAPVPVHTIPIPVSPPAFAPRSRAELGLPDGEFLFLVSFDHLSADDLARKNPLAVVEAFTRAFGPGDGAAVHLVVAGPSSEPLRAATATHPGIQVIDGPMTRAESTRLTAICDCYVSLHRAEAFGLSIAEAMWLGKPVIATGFSGNADYMTAENGLLVDYRLLAGGADPDLDHAAGLMERVFNDPASGQALGARAAADIRRTHSPAAAGAIIGRRLEAIRATGQVPRRAAGPHPGSAELARVQARITQGPPPLRRGGPAVRARALLRQMTLRAVRPHSRYQHTVNVGLAAALESHIASLTTGNAVERAQLLAELRGSRQLRLAVEGQARGLDETRRIVSLQSDRGLFLAIAELGRRHAAIAAAAGEPGERPEPLALSTFELRAYSQNGEDGVLAEILRRVGVASRFFVEFGVESGREGNCIYLADVAGWRGLFMEADEEFYRLLERKYAPRDDVRTLRARITHENIEELFAEGGAPEQPDVVSIDIDGQDYWIWEAIESYRPRVVVIEYNSALDPRRRLVQPREPGASWDGTDYMGASLGAIRALGERKGYQLVHTELAGANAFLVRADLAEGKFPDPDEVSVRGMPNYFGSGHRHPRDPLGRRYLDLDTGELAPAR